MKAGELTQQMAAGGYSGFFSASADACAPDPAVQQLNAAERARRDAELRERASFHFMARASNSGTLPGQADLARAIPPSPSSVLLNVVTNRSMSLSGSSTHSCLGAASGNDSFDSGASGGRLERFHVETICKFLMASTPFLHALQAERGASTIFIASSGQMMADRLQNFRNTTDHYWEFLQQAPMFHPQLMPGLLESWKSIRSAVDYRCLPYLDVVINYSHILDQVLDAVTSVSQPLQKTAVGASVASLLLLQRMKESCALQRGTVGGVLASGVLQMEWNVYLTLIKNLAKLEAFDSAFKLLAQADVSEVLLRDELPPLVQEFQIRLQVSKEMVEGMLLTTTAEQWFKESTDRIESLDGVQQCLVHSIQTTARQICRDEDLVLALFDNNAEDQGEQTGAVMGSWPVFASFPAPRSPMSPPSLKLKKQLSIPADQLEIGEEVGSGSTGITYCGRWRGHTVAVKAILKGALLHGQSGVRRSFVQELSMLSQLHHPNICSFYGASVDPPRYFLVIEYMDQGSLWSFLRECPEEIDFFNVALQVAHGLKYLHEMAYLVHRDVKSLNILLNSRGEVKISDFGLSCIGTEVEVSGLGAGTTRWMAPEVMASQPHSFASDIYSFGIVLWELVTKDIPFRMFEVSPGILSPMAATRVGKEGMRPSIPAGTPELISKLISDCLHQDPGKRPSAGDVLCTLKAAKEKLQGADLDFLAGKHPTLQCVPCHE